MNESIVNVLNGKIIVFSFKFRLSIKNDSGFQKLFKIAKNLNALSYMMVERIFCSNNLMTMHHHLQVIYPYNITGTHAGCISRLDDRFDEIFKKSKDRNIQERSKLWGFIAISNVNILGIIFISKCCL